MSATGVLFAQARASATAASSALPGDLRGRHPLRGGVIFAERRIDQLEDRLRGQSGARNESYFRDGRAHGGLRNLAGLFRCSNDVLVRRRGVSSITDALRVPAPIQLTDAARPQLIRGRAAAHAAAFSDIREALA